MVNRVQVFYEGWGERWHWGTLAKTNNPATPIFVTANAKLTHPAN